MLPTFARRTAAVAVAVLLLAVSASAYTVKYIAVKETLGVSAYMTDGACTAKESYPMMPTKASFQTQAYNTLRGAGFGKVPIGAAARQAACFDKYCTWQFNRGLFSGYELTFFEGVYVDGVLKASETASYYNNWASDHPSYWPSRSYFGKRQVGMASDGTWFNWAILELYTEWICENYVYDRDDHIFFPTFVNGDPIVGDTQSKLTHCNKVLQLNSVGEYLDVRCESKIEWWVGLVIAVVLFTAVLVAVPIVWGCLIRRKNLKETKRREDILANTGDNGALIPNQSQIAIGGLQYADDEYDEED